MQTITTGIGNTFQRYYVVLMMDIVGRGLQAMSQMDETIKQEISVFPTGMIFKMNTLPDGPCLVMEKSADGRFIYRGSKTPGKPDLSIEFKHLAHAFLVFSFQEGTAQAVANDRLVVNGDTSNAIRVVRCLNHMESYILPKFIAERAVKRYPPIGLVDKVTHGAHIYGRLTLNFFKGN